MIVENYGLEYFAHCQIMPRKLSGPSGRLLSDRADAQDWHRARQCEASSVRPRRNQAGATVWNESSPHLGNKQYRQPRRGFSDPRLATLRVILTLCVRFAPSLAITQPHGSRVAHLTPFSHQANMNGVGGLG
jgi:hypothetical protein